MPFKNEVAQLVASSAAQVLYACPLGAEASAHAVIANAPAGQGTVTLSVYRHAEGAAHDVATFPVVSGTPYAFPKPINLSEGDELRARCLTVDIAITASVLERSAGAPSNQFNPRGVYDDAATYNRMDVVAEAGASYIRLTDGGLGDRPPSAGWMLSATAVTDALLAPNNLSDIADAAAARRNIYAMAAQWTVVSSNYQAEIGDRVACDVTSGPLAVTLPSSPAEGDTVSVGVVRGDPTLNPVAINPGSYTVVGASTLNLDLSRVVLDLIFLGSEWGYV